jgi:hypothetical protein
MSFLAPLYLLGAALIALPIVLHLLRRDVAPPVPFTAVSLLRKSPVDRSRRHRLRDLILLAARVAALLLIAASFARPYAAGAPASTRTTVVAVDRSFSMGGGSRFERARALAREAIDGAGGGRIAVIAFDDRADVVAQPGTAADARAALAGLRPGHGATRYAAAFDKAAELLRDVDGARVVIVTDLQRTGFEENPAVLPEDIDLVVHDAGAHAANLSVTSAAIDRREVAATVRNFGVQPRTTDVRATADDRPLPARRVTIPPGGAVDVAFETAAPVTRLVVAVDDAGGYAADDERFGVAQSRALPRILIVGGGPASEAGFYVSRALQADAEEGSAFDVRTVTGTAFAAMTAEEMRAESAIVLLATHGIDRRAAEPLRAFVKGGGGVLAAAAPEVDPAVLSTLLGWDPAIAAREVRGAGALVATDLRHPVFRPFGAVAANFGQVSFDRAWRIDTGDDWRVLARYTDGSAALAERAGAEGRVLIFTSDLDRRWNDFPLHPAFVPFAQEAVRYLGARPPSVSGYEVADVPAGVPAAPGIVRAGSRTLAINVDPRESTLDRVTPLEFRKLVARTASTARPRAERLAHQVEASQSYWRYGLMLLLATLVVEAFVGSRT